MTKPKNIHFRSLKLLEKKKLKNGVRYEHWRNEIDNTHHIHFPDGTLITFRHEDCEGSVEIKE